MKKILQIFTPVLAFFGFVGTALAYTEEEITATVSAALDATITSVIDTAIEFLANNLPLIVTLGVAVGILFWLIRKAIKAVRGRT